MARLATRPAVCRAPSAYRDADYSGGFSRAIGIIFALKRAPAPAPLPIRMPRSSFRAFVLAWLAGGAYALLGVVSLAELGVLIPRSGGQYVFARRAFAARDVERAGKV